MIQTIYNKERRRRGRREGKGVTKAGESKGREKARERRRREMREGEGVTKER